MRTTIEKAVLQLKNDEVVAIPTETVYGLAGNAYSEKAVRRIFEIKKRPAYNPLIVHIKSVDYLDKVAREVPDAAFRLAGSFWPGPLTIVLKKQNSIPEVVTSGLDTVGVRVPNHPLALQLLNKLDFPLAAPSANPFGSISPTTAAHVLNYFSHSLNVLDGGHCLKGIESTIIGFDNNGEPVLYRYGSISLEEIESKIGKVRIITEEKNKPAAPGMLSRHYAPATEAYLAADVNERIKEFSGKKIGLLLFKERIPKDPLIYQEVLSQTGDMEEASKNLYAAIHRLDKKNLDVIIFQQLPERGLGIAINDKLRRAAKKVSFHDLL